MAQVPISFLSYLLQVSLLTKSKHSWFIFLHEPNLSGNSPFFEYHNNYKVLRETVH